MEKNQRKDIEGKQLFIDDTVEVVEEEKMRAGNPGYKFCSVGKQGKILNNGCWGTGVLVEFKTAKGPHSVGCYMRNLKKI